MATSEVEGGGFCISLVEKNLIEDYIPTTKVFLRQDQQSAPFSDRSNQYCNRAGNATQPH